MEQSPLAPPELVLLHEAPENFSVLLQGGFEMLLPRPCTVREFICGLVGVSEDYAQKHIQTIFVDGKAIDDLNEAMLGPGSRLALSAALPGLVGATMRRGGFYSRLREGITHHADTESATDIDKPFLLQVRLFNAVGRDLAENFLEFGVIVPARTLKTFLLSRPATFFHNLRKASLNGSPLPVEPSGPASWPLPQGDVVLQVQSNR
ncbi:MAG TPA: hypothetical protein ENN39_03665 [Desulfonatronum sp.]|nr:hypothetical protein [Desulfonatronum sp.]